MSPNQRRALERAQRAQRMFAFQGVEPAHDDALPVTVIAAQAFATGLPEQARVHTFPVRAGAFTPFRLKEAA